MIDTPDQNLKWRERRTVAKELALQLAPLNLFGEALRPQQIGISSEDASIVAADPPDVIEGRRRQRVRNKCEGVNVACLHVWLYPPQTQSQTLRQLDATYANDELPYVQKTRFVSLSEGKERKAQAQPPPS